MFTSCSEKFGPVFPHEKYNYDIRCMHVGQDMILCTYLLVWETTLTTNSTNFFLTNCFQTNYTQLGDSVKVNSNTIRNPYIRLEFQIALALFWVNVFFLADSILIRREERKKSGIFSMRPEHFLNYPQF